MILVIPTLKKSWMPILTMDFCLCFYFFYSNDIFDYTIISHYKHMIIFIVNKSIFVFHYLTLERYMMYMYTMSKGLLTINLNLPHVIYVFQNLKLQTYCDTPIEFSTLVSYSNYITIIFLGSHTIMLPKNIFSSIIYSFLTYSNIYFLILKKMCHIVPLARVSSSSHFWSFLFAIASLCRLPILFYFYSI